MGYILFGVVVVVVVGLAKALGASSDAWHPVKIESVTTTPDRPSLEDFAKLAPGQFVVVFLERGSTPIAANLRLFAEATTSTGALTLSGSYDSVFAWPKAHPKPAKSDLPKKGDQFTFPAGYVFAVCDPEKYACPEVASD